MQKAFLLLPTLKAILLEEHKEFIVKDRQELFANNETSEY